MSSNYGKVGAVSFPIDPLDIQNSLSEAMDPTLTGLLAMFEGAITAELGEAWTSVSAPLEGISSDVVAETLPFEPSKYLTLGVDFDFPLLALYRTQSRRGLWTQSEQFRISKLRLEYILPPLSPLGMGKLEAIRAGVDAVIFDILNKGKHAAYNDGYTLDSLGLADIGGEAFLSSYGSWEVPEGDSFVIHPTLMVDFEIKEITGYGVNLPRTPFEGSDVTYTEGTDPVQLAEDELDV